VLNPNDQKKEEKQAYLPYESPAYVSVKNTVQASVWEAEALGSAEAAPEHAA